MNKKILLILVLVLSIFLRVFKIESHPATLYGDEQAFAWNAYNILKTGQDEYGISYPLQFRSFNDYKAPIPVYLLVPFIRIFDLNSFSIRLPIVVASVITVFFVYLLTRQFFGYKISLLSTFLMSISPWHIHLSRGYFESTLALLFFISGNYFYLKYLRRPNSLKNIIISMFFFALTIYSYFTPRILLIIYLPFLFWYGYKYAFISEYPENQLGKTFLKNFITGFIFFFLICLPMVWAAVGGEGLSRFNKLSESVNQVVVESVNKERNTSLLPAFWKTVMHNKLTVKLNIIKNNYFEHLSANFWYLYGDNSLRYFLGNMGMFYLLEMPFFIIGLIYLLRNNFKISIFLLGWILLTPIPASIVGRPFAVRSLAMLPVPFIFTSIGVVYFINFFVKTRKMFAIKVICLMFVLSLGSVLVRYYFEYPVYAATWWGWENKAAFDYARSYEKSFDNIFISDFYTGAPLAFAVYQKYDPLQFRNAVNNPVTMADGRKLIKLGKYYFGSLDIDKNRQNLGIIPPHSLYIARPEEVDGIETINAPDDNRVIFKIYKN